MSSSEFFLFCYDLLLVAWRRLHGSADLVAPDSVRVLTTVNDEFKAISRLISAYKRIVAIGPRVFARPPTCYRGSV